jgi:hypothetical protein
MEVRWFCGEFLVWQKFHKFLIWKLINFDECKCVSLLWETGPDQPKGWGSCSPRPGAWRSPNLRTFYNFFLLVLKNSPAAPFYEHFLGYHFTKILLSGHFPQKFRLRRRLTFFFLLLCLSRGPQKASCPGPSKTLIRPWWEMNSYYHCFSHSKVYIRGWYSWLFRCVWDVKNSGYKNSSPTEVKCTFIHQIVKFLSNQKLSTKTAHLYLSFGTFSY